MSFQRLWMSCLIILAAALFAALPVNADIAKPPVGQPAPAFELVGSDGQKHKLDEYKGKIVVLHWEAVTCPWDQAYQPILNKVSSDFSKDVVFVGINSNKNDSMDDVKGIIKEDGIPYLVLKDPGNKIADAYGAQTTPHMFIIDAKGVLRYKGGIEKAPTSPNGVGQSQEQYLVPVLKALVAGQEPPVTETKSKGCSVKRE